MSCLKFSNLNLKHRSLPLLFLLNFFKSLKVIVYSLVLLRTQPHHDGFEA